MKSLAKILLLTGSLLISSVGQGQNKERPAYGKENKSNIDKLDEGFSIEVKADKSKKEIGIIYIDEERKFIVNAYDLNKDGKSDVISIHYLNQLENISKKDSSSGNYLKETKTFYRGAEARDFLYVMKDVDSAILSRKFENISEEEIGEIKNISGGKILSLNSYNGNKLFEESEIKKSESSKIRNFFEIIDKIYLGKVKENRIKDYLKNERLIN
jgi:hypothetical protein